MREISIDLESYSDIDLSSCGVYRYAESPAFEILLFGYSIDGAPVEVVDLTSGDKIPDGILRALSDPKIKKWAFNAMFERVCLSTYLHRHYPQYITTDYKIRFAYEATGQLTRFTDYNDIKYRSRAVFSFHRPETLLSTPDVFSTRSDKTILIAAFTSFSQSYRKQQPCSLFAVYYNNPFFLCQQYTDAIASATTCAILSLFLLKKVMSSLSSMNAVSSSAYFTPSSLQTFIL